MGAHLRVAFFQAGGKKEREAWRWLKPLEVEQIAMAWGYTKVAQRAEKRFLDLHTHELQEGEQRSSGEAQHQGDSEVSTMRSRGICGLTFEIFSLEKLLLLQKLM